MKKTLFAEITTGNSLLYASMHLVIWESMTASTIGKSGYFLSAEEIKVKNIEIITGFDNLTKC